MHTISTLTNPRTPPRPTRSATRLASIDVEWTKNYRIKNGNKPFCLSIVWLDIPRRGPVDLAGRPYDFTSLYVEHTEEIPDLVESAGIIIRSALDSADLVTGHQLCADLAVLDAHDAPQPVADARTAWHDRHALPEDGTQVFDTRYDTGHILTGTSRRLVDVCTELNLDVTQPELRSTSMTALHRKWLDAGDTSARERISVLNLRHSLSTAYVAARACGLATWDEPINVNRAIADGAASRWEWLTSPAFSSLLGAPRDS
ncbi:hypothetical protein [Kitasatospora sp. NPDC096140]|uniref:hypothetical protein n=1 Tax=Kitasatospora sp. NPDC096140 TaxID=3155425 RepID=UPI00332F6206